MSVFRTCTSGVSYYIVVLVLEIGVFDFTFFGDSPKTDIYFLMEERLSVMIPLMDADTKKR